MFKKKMVGDKQFTISVEAADEVQGCLQPLSKKTGGQYQVATLSVEGIGRAFSSVGASITATRVSGGMLHPPRTALDNRFDPSTGQDDCARICTISAVRTSGIRKKRWGNDRLIVKCLGARCNIGQKCFAEGAMRFVYRLSDQSSLNED
ncbi:unnamed protein product [Prorocentrum cordatum]|uniref:Uncharacterized protein n=1 Tax=Prorocentrum cordatum TaxID=2364126 RepID=A0ABN9X3A7_9DINO|nr:unnamed protein product [Polarella glacialis]